MSGQEKFDLHTCTTCRVRFFDGELQRSHYKSDWHRYNLKRVLVEMAPVTQEQFLERVAAQESLKSKEANDKESRNYCASCKKSFRNEKAFANHIVSRKHVLLMKDEESTTKEVNVVKEVPATVPSAGSSSGSAAGSSNVKKGVVKMDVDSEDEEDEEWEEFEGTPISPNNCLFCEKENENIERNIEHMSRAHSFFIPDLEYCSDPEGLLVYLGEKVGEGLVCLWCCEKGKQFYSLESVQQHMRDKGHCKMLHEGEAFFEYTDFYDYSSSYPEGSGEVNPDEVYQPDPVHFNEFMQLVLPSGVTLGHRSLKIYYKQYIRPGNQISIYNRAQKSAILNKYKAIGYGEASQTIAQQKFRDQKRFKHIQDKFRVKLGLQGNKNLQTYFRRQVQF